MTIKRGDQVITKSQTQCIAVTDGYFMNQQQVGGNYVITLLTDFVAIRPTQFAAMAIYDDKVIVVFRDQVREIKLPDDVE